MGQNSTLEKGSNKVIKHYIANLLTLEFTKFHPRELDFINLNTMES